MADGNIELNVTVEMDPIIHDVLNMLKELNEQVDKTVGTIEKEEFCFETGKLCAMTRRYASKISKMLTESIVSERKSEYENVLQNISIKLGKLEDSIDKEKQNLINNNELNPLRKNLRVVTNPLSKMFNAQKKLNERLGFCFPIKDQDVKIYWILQFTRALQQEISELIDSVPWKWWAKYQVFNEQNAKVEVIDIMHFLISIALCLDITAEDFYSIYMQKMKVNHKRQDSGYVKKDESDNKGITQ